MIGMHDYLGEPEPTPQELRALYGQNGDLAPKSLRPVAEVVAELGRPLTRKERLGLIPEEELWPAIAAGYSMNALAKSLGVTWWDLHAWLHEEAGRRESYQLARRLAAVSFEERAEEVLLSAPSSGAEVTRARALSALLSKRAAAHDPALYGEKVQALVAHTGLDELRERIHAAGSRLPIAGPESPRAGG